jgi:uncharacterized protein (UPF0210 family)
MTFGQVKSIIEKNLIESYNNESDFKKSLKEFKHNVLSNKNISKIYDLYDQLSSPQGLSESDAKEFINEGVDLIRKFLENIKLPKTISENENNYSDIDTLVYLSKTSIKERLSAKKSIVKVLMSEKTIAEKTISLPIKSMVSIANQTLNSYIQTLDEISKKTFFQLISEDSKDLETKFETIRENTINKLNVILENEKEIELKTKISETIEKIKIEKFDQLNFLKLKNLEESL